MMIVDTDKDTVRVECYVCGEEGEIRILKKGIIDFPHRWVVKVAPNNSVFLFCPVHCPKD